MLQKIILLAMVFLRIHSHAQLITVFSDNFENASPVWQSKGSTSPNLWQKGNCAGNGPALAGTNSIYISDGTSVSGCNPGYSYQNSPSGTGQSLIYTAIDAACASSLQINFDYQTGGVINQDYTELVYSQDGGTTWHPIGSALAVQGSWLNVTSNLPAPLDFSSFLLGFRFIFNDVTISGLPTAIDNIKISGLDTQAPVIICPKDTALCTNVVNFTDPFHSDNCFSVLTRTDATGLTSGDIFPVGTTKLSYTAKDPSSNEASCSFTVTVQDFPSKSEIVLDSISLCQAFSTKIEALPATSGQGKWSSFNSSQINFNDNEANLTQVNNLSFGKNTLIWTVTSAKCGSLSDTLNIYVYQKPLPASTFSDTLLLCNNKLLDLSAANPLYGAGLWTTNKGAVIANATMPKTTATGLSNGWNQFVWEVKNGSCPSTSDTMQVYQATVAKIDQPDTSICLEYDKFTLSGVSTSTEETSDWRIISGNATIDKPFENPTHISGLNAGAHLISYTISSDYCFPTSDTLVITSQLCDSFQPDFPTVITPNLDGKNDAFLIDNLNEIYPDCRVTIINRWGSIVFKSAGYENPWNGTFNNEDLPMGTYFFKIELNDDDKTVFNGPISIIR
jgi:gliding motility-associated-like protein